MTGPVTVVIDSDWVPPVDFVLEMDGSTSPASIYAGTTWTQLKNCIIFAAGSTFRAGTSGGGTSVSLTTSHLPSHNHSVSISSVGNHQHTTTTLTRSSGFSFGAGTNDPSRAARAASYTSGSGGGHGHTLTIGSTGNGQSWSIMNPYYAVNIWQRVG